MKSVCFSYWQIIFIQANTDTQSYTVEKKCLINFLNIRLKSFLGSVIDCLSIVDTRSVNNWNSFGIYKETDSVVT